MVNAAKRMRALADLYHIRNGPASVSLPSHPTPQLTRIYMRLPTGVHPLQTTHHGARAFWRSHLQRLKYYNPALKCTVDTVRDGSETDPMYLSVSYSSPDRNILERIDNTLPHALGTPSEPKTADGKKSPKESLEATGQQVELTAAILSHAPSAAIVETPVDTSPAAPQTTSPPRPLFSRTLTLPLANVRSQEIWGWIRQHTGLPDQRDVPTEDREERQRLDAFYKQAEVERQRVKKGIDAMRREEAELKKAREAAERMAADV